MAGLSTNQCLNWRLIGRVCSMSIKTLWGGNPIAPCHSDGDSCSQFTANPRSSYGGGSLGGGESTLDPRRALAEEKSLNLTPTRISRLEPCGTPFILSGTITGLNFPKWVKSLSLVKDSISPLSVLEWNNLLNITLLSSNFIFFFKKKKWVETYFSSQ